MSPARDNQRSRVYEAEALVRRLLDRATEFPMIQVAGSRLVLPIERRFRDVSEIQTYVDELLTDSELRHRWPAAREAVTVRARAGLSSAHYEPGRAVIAIPEHDWARRELVVLHELAHHLGGPYPTTGVDTEGPAWHGPDFAARLLELILRQLGPEAELLLRVTFGDLSVTVG